MKFRYRCSFLLKVNELFNNIVYNKVSFAGRTYNSNQVKQILDLI